MGVAALASSKEKTETPKNQENGEKEARKTGEKRKGKRGRGGCGQGDTETV